MAIYGTNNRELGELIDLASEMNAILLVPELQRPYVWAPDQVQRLVDSLLRGWPFGTLLLWQLDRTRQGETPMPSRTFWRSVSRVQDVAGDGFGPAAAPAKFEMVLDGQQRLQSLVLAFATQDGGLVLPDREWKASLTGVLPHGGGNAKKHWTRGQLHLDLTAFDREITPEDNLKPFPDYLELFVWARPATAQAINAVPTRRAGYEEPLPLVQKHPGRFILGCRLWSIARHPQANDPTWVQASVQGLLEEHEVSVEKRGRFATALVQLIQLRLAPATRQRVDYLYIHTQSNSGIADTGTYHEAIVNIFTRLNSAGRALTRSEITFSWIKVEWDRLEAADKLHGTGAAESIEKLRATLNEVEPKLELQSDGLVKMLSNVWSTFEREQGRPLADRDLLDGQTVIHLARWLHANWLVLSSSLERTSRTLANEDVRFGLHYRSENALTLVAAACFALEHWASQPVQDRAKVSHEIAASNSRWLVRERLAKWLALSQWAEEWAKSTDETLSTYANRLNSWWGKQAQSNDYEGVLNSMKGELESWIAALKDKAVQHIEGLAVDDARAVGRYRLPLAVWHGLEQNRQKWSEFTLQHSTKAQFTYEVDHVVAQKMWETMVAGQADITENSHSELLETLNSLGNCILLKKTFNIGKSARPLDDWLSSDLKSLAGFDSSRWKDAFAIVPVMSQPRAQDLKAIQDAIARRRLVIVHDLVEWIQDTAARKPAHLADAMDAAIAD